MRQFFLIIFLLLQFSAYGQSCSDLLGQLLGNDRSVAHRLVSNYFRPTNWKIPLEQRYPGVERRIADIWQLVPDTNSFTSQFMHQYRRMPTFAEFVEHIGQRHEAVVGRLRSLERIDPDLGLFLENIVQTLKKRFDGVSKGLKKYSEFAEQGLDMLTSEQLHAVNNYVIALHGELGELKGFIRTANLLATNVRGNQMSLHPASRNFSEMMARQIEKTFENYSVDDIGYLQRKYPMIFKKERHGVALTAQNAFDEAKRFLLSKEIDIIVDEGGGKVGWVEVKKRSMVIDLSTLMYEEHHSKSILDQLQEDIEMSDFLRWSDKVKLYLYPVNGITGEAVRKLKGLGVAVSN